MKSNYTKAGTPRVPGGQCGTKNHRAMESFEGEEIRQAPQEEAGRVKTLATEVLPSTRSGGDSGCSLVKEQGRWMTPAGPEWMGSG